MLRSKQNVVGGTDQPDKLAAPVKRILFVVKTIDDLFPPDDIDLYSEGNAE